MNNTGKAFKLLLQKNIGDTLASQIEQCFNPHKRVCSVLSDEQFIFSSISRVISQNKSGREFLQNYLEAHGIGIARSTFFEALHSLRRLNSVYQVASNYYKLLNQYLFNDGVDYLKEFDDIAEYEVLSVDGHYIEHASHAKRLKKHSTVLKTPLKKRQRKNMSKILKKESKRQRLQGNRFTHSCIQAVQLVAFHLNL